MEYAGFLRLPQQNNIALRITSWNINGARNKLENTNVYNFLSDFDIISLNEVKSSMHISIPGYVSFKSKHVTGAAALRGGTVVLVKNYLANQVFNYDNSITDQVWFQVQCVPDTMFGFCYVPPADSQYFNHLSYVALHEKMLNFQGNTKFFIIGDLNARFGLRVRDIPLQSNNPLINQCTYPVIPDETSAPNDNAYLLSTVCIDHNLLVLNNVKSPTKYFPSQKTFKRRNQWISELDTTVVSHELLNNLSNFTVHQNDWLPSDHAPISIDLTYNRFNINCISSRASNLGGHGSLMGQSVNAHIGNKPIRFNQIDVEIFSNKILNSPLPSLDNIDVNTIASDFADTLYNHVKSSSLPSHNVASALNINPSVYTSYHKKWDKLLHDPDDSRVWKALDWKGQFSDNDSNKDLPSDEDFKHFYESNINLLSNNSHVLNVDIENNVSIPVLDNLFTPLEVSNQIDNMKADKSSGLDGIPPGVYKLLTPAWIILITSLFNIIFTSATYPVSWTKAKLFMLFKRGDSKDPNNYRGIYVINSLANLYDSM